MLSETTVLRQNSQVPSTEIHGEIVLMSSQMDRYYSLAGSAASVWTALKNATTIDGICNSLISTYAVDEETCRRDVIEFIESLASCNLISIADA